MPVPYILRTDFNAVAKLQGISEKRATMI